MSQNYGADLRSSRPEKTNRASRNPLANHGVGFEIYPRGKELLGNGGTEHPRSIGARDPPVWLPDQPKEPTTRTFINRATHSYISAMSSEHPNRPTRILFVCLGNICRSPIAEGVFRHKLVEIGRETHFEVDSAGTGAWHVGEPPDRRMRQTARSHGLSIDDLRARRVEAQDLFDNDLILAMDRSNFADLKTFDVPDAYRGRVKLFRSFDPEADSLDVPDPYYGGGRGFEDVYEIVSRTCDALIRHFAEHADSYGGS